MRLLDSFEYFWALWALLGTFGHSEHFWALWAKVPREPKSAPSAQKCRCLKAPRVPKNVKKCPERPKVPKMVRKCPELSNPKKVYDSLSDVGEIRVYQRADFQSGSRVLKKVF